MADVADTASSGDVKPPACEGLTARSDLTDAPYGEGTTANATNEGNATVEIEVNATVVDDANATNATNATVIPSLDEILAEVGDVEDDEEERGTRDEL